MPFLFNRLWLKSLAKSQKTMRLSGFDWCHRGNSTDLVQVLFLDCIWRRIIFAASTTTTINTTTNTTTTAASAPTIYIKLLIIYELSLYDFQVDTFLRKVYFYITLFVFNYCHLLERLLLAATTLSVTASGHRTVAKIVNFVV